MRKNLYSNYTLRNLLDLEEKLRVLVKQPLPGGTAVWVDGQRHFVRIKTLSERFFEKVNKNGQIPAYNPRLGACWEWKGAMCDLGYGSFGVRHKHFRAYRVSYTLLVGNIPENLELDHLCRNPSCVNPSHLEPVTHQVNSLRGISPLAKHAQQTHCIRGHAFTPENIQWTHYKGGNQRHCKACGKIWWKEYRERKRKTKLCL